MPIIKSAKKALRQSRKHHLINVRIERRLKSTIKVATKQSKPGTLAASYKIIDIARKHHLIHPNKARHLKSKLARLAYQSKKSN